MLLQQEQHLQELLKQWREERHITLQNKRDGLIDNLHKKANEHYKAINESKKIYALCDTSIFAYNSLSDDIENFWKKYNNFLYNEFFSSSVIDAVRVVGICVLNEYAESKINEQLYKLIKTCEKKAIEMGYDFYKCMLETIKEISSRTGHYDENIHKFVKDNSEEAIKKWHKADYSKCKIKG